MTELTSEVIARADLGASDRDAMFSVMTMVYEGMNRDNFDADLLAKDEVIVLRDEGGTVVGFSTQQIIRLAEGVTGVFSGDTVIHPDHWGSLVLMQAFTQHNIVERDEPWWWFLISKGHRTYRMLPTFFIEFWPNRRMPTPHHAQAVMDAYATALYGDDYDKSAGVIIHHMAKDYLREGVAGVTEQSLCNPETAFFVERNPGHALGHELVCLAELSPSNLRPCHRERLYGRS